MTSEPANEQVDDSRVIPTPVFAGLAVLLVLLVVLTIYVWGRWAFDVVITAGFLGLLVMHLIRDRRDEDTRADVDEALRGLDDLKDHAFGLTQPPTGRHAHPADHDRYPTNPFPTTNSTWRSA